MLHNILEKVFPFEEIREKWTGDFFNAPSDALKEGYSLSQIWSVATYPSGLRNTRFIYGPSLHYMDVLGYVATKEHHDGKTYYEFTCEVAD